MVNLIQGFDHQHTRKKSEFLFGCLSFVKTQAIVLKKLIERNLIKLDQFASGGVMILNVFSKSIDVPSLCKVCMFLQQGHRLGT